MQAQNKISLHNWQDWLLGELTNKEEVTTLLSAQHTLFENYFQDEKLPETFSGRWNYRSRVLNTTEPCLWINILESNYPADAFIMQEHAVFCKNSWLPQNNIEDSSAAGFMLRFAQERFDPRIQDIIAQAA